VAWFLDHPVGKKVNPFGPQGGADFWPIT